MRRPHPASHKTNLPYHAGCQQPQFRHAILRQAPSPTTSRTASSSSSTRTIRPAYSLSCRKATPLTVRTAECGLFYLQRDGMWIDGIARGTRRHRFRHVHRSNPGRYPVQSESLFGFPDRRLARFLRSWGMNWRRCMGIGGAKLNAQRAHDHQTFVLFTMVSNFCTLSAVQRGISETSTLINHQRSIAMSLKDRPSSRPPGHQFPGQSDRRSRCHSRRRRREPGVTRRQRTAVAALTEK